MGMSNGTWSIERNEELLELPCKVIRFRNDVIDERDVAEEVLAHLEFCRNDGEENISIDEGWWLEQQHANPPVLSIGIGETVSLVLLIETTANGKPFYSAMGQKFERQIFEYEPRPQELNYGDWELTITVRRKEFQTGFQMYWNDL